MPKQTEDGHKLRNGRTVVATYMPQHIYDVVKREAAKRGMAVSGYINNVLYEKFTSEELLEPADKE